MLASRLNCTSNDSEVKDKSTGQEAVPCVFRSLNEITLKLDGILRKGIAAREFEIIGYRENWFRDAAEAFVYLS